LLEDQVVGSMETRLVSYSCDESDLQAKRSELKLS